MLNKGLPNTLWQLLTIMYLKKIFKNCLQTKCIMDINFCKTVFSFLMHIGQLLGHIFNKLKGKISTTVKLL